MRRNTLKEILDRAKLQRKDRFIIKGDQEKAAALRKKPTRSVS